MLTANNCILGASLWYEFGTYPVDHLVMTARDLTYRALRLDMAFIFSPKPGRVFYPGYSVPLAQSWSLTASTGNVYKKRNLGAVIDT